MQEKGLNTSGSSEIYQSRSSNSLLFGVSFEILGFIRRQQSDGQTFNRCLSAGHQCGFIDNHDGRYLSTQLFPTPVRLRTIMSKKGRASWSHYQSTSMQCYTCYTSHQLSNALTITPLILLSILFFQVGSHTIPGILAARKGSRTYG